jgi:hypothetical protein
MIPAMRSPIVVLPILSLLALAACGGGGDDGGGGGRPGGIAYTPGVFPAASIFADRCPNPRTGIDQWTNLPWRDRAGSALHEKHFLRSWTNDLYLWFDEVPDTDPLNTGGLTGGVLDYFNQLKTTALAPGGQPKDNFHFTYDTEEYRDLSSGGIVLGYGISWRVISPQPPREIVVEFVQAGSPAGTQGIRRGDRLQRIDTINVVTNDTQAGVDFIIAAAFNPGPGESHTMEFRDRDGMVRSVPLTAEQVSFDAVPAWDVFDVGFDAVGYLLFNDHSAIAEGQLIEAIDALAAEQVDELVLDLRYNGGGYLDIASELAYMIAGPGVTAGRTFERLQFNSKHPVIHPLSGSPITPVPFHSTTQDFSIDEGQPLPWLGLSRVFVLTSGLTCSASESLINGLRGVGIEVHQIGGDTCGKPYGFYPRDNCGTTYFSIQFRGVNDIGFGDYVEGFSATRVGGPPLANLPGCAAYDDFSRDLGDPLEGQLAAGLSYLATGSCPPVIQKMEKSTLPLTPAEEAIAVRLPPRLPWRDNRIVR